MRTAMAMGVLVMLSAQAPEARSAPLARITVKVVNVKAAKGKFLVSLHDSAKTFPGKSAIALRHEWVAVTTAPEATYVFEAVAPGTYAVGVAHDLNDNGGIDTGLFRIPVEPIGVSKNPKTFLGPPSFDQAKFEVGASDVALTIELRG